MYVKVNNMPRRTAEEAARTRADLVAEGLLYFTERPYASAPLQELVARLGVTRGALYHHFGSKRGYFEAVVEWILEQLGHRIVREAERAGEGRDGLKAGCDTFLAAATDATFRQIVLIDAPAVLGWQAWKELDDRTTSRTLREGLDELRQAGELESEDTEALAAALSGAMNELALWVAAQPRPRRALPRAQAAVAAMLEVFHPTP